MRNIKITITATLLSVVSVLLAQSSANSNANVQQSQTAPTQKKPYTTPPINEDDPYMGRTEEFLHIMVVDKLPADFPKYDKSMGLRKYNQIVDNYLASHLYLLKDKWKEKLSGGQQH